MLAPALVTVKVEVVIVAGFMALLNVAVMTAVLGKRSRHLEESQMSPQEALRERQDSSMSQSCRYRYSRQVRRPKGTPRCKDSEHAICTLGSPHCWTQAFHTSPTPGNNWTIEILSY